MKIAAIQKLTLMDFPGAVSCLIFTPGCNFRCGFCHNPEMVLPEKVKVLLNDLISEEAFFAFLEERKDLLEGVCISGGEPTLQLDLIEFIEKVRALGFKVKLDSNGTRPEVLEELFEKKLLDYIAMDIKASELDYSLVSGVDIDIEKIKKSRDLIMNSAVEYEFRTTVVPDLHKIDEFSNLLEFIKGAKKFFIQNFRSKAGCLDARFENLRSFYKGELDEMKMIADEYVDFCEIRN